jgi:hypothetical protein
MVRLNNLVVIATTLAVMVLPPVFVFDLAYASYEIVVSVLLLVSALGLRAQPLTANDVDEE